eukprot:scaffold2144_cov215-Pinguiococcus_pyrenoidosus.AAC.12
MLAESHHQSGCSFGTAFSARMSLEDLVDFERTSVSASPEIPSTVRPKACAGCHFARCCFAQLDATIGAILLTSATYRLRRGTGGIHRLSGDTYLIHRPSTSC